MLYCAPGMAARLGVLSNISGGKPVPLFMLTATGDTKQFVVPPSGSYDGRSRNLAISQARAKNS